MRMVIFNRFILIVAVIFLPAATCEIYVCSYSSKSWTQVGNLYSCTVNSILTGTSTELEETSGNHAIGFSNSDTEGVLISKKPVKKFPANLASFFPNLKAIQLYTVELEKISSNDLKFFVKLEFLNLAFNFLQTLDGNLFQFTPRIKLFHVHNNKLEKIGPGILDSLRDLSEADFQANVCISSNAASPEEIVVLKDEILTSCPFPDEIVDSTTKFLLPKTTVEACPIRCLLDDETEELRLKIRRVTNFSNDLQTEILKMKNLNDQLEIEKQQQKERIAKLQRGHRV
jgi:hypothetical protein